MKISTKKSEEYFIRAGVFFSIVLFSLAFSTSALAETFSSVNGSESNGTIEVSPETVAPAWRLIWEKARHMGRNGDVDGAIALYRNLLEQRPGLSEARFELAGLFLRAGEKQPAMIELGKVLEARPQHLRALLSMAELLKESGQYKRAVDLYKRAEDLLARQARASDAGDHGNGQGGSAEKVDHFKVETGLYSSLRGLHRESEALVHLKKALSLRPGDRSLELKLAGDLLELGRARDALTHLRHLAPALRDDPSFIREYVRAMDACSMISGIRKLLKPLILPLTRPEVPCPKGWTADDMEWGIQKLYGIYLLDDDTKSAVALLQGIRDAHPEWISPGLLRSLGRIYFSQRRYIACISTFTSLVVRCPKDKEAYLFLARAFQKLQMINKAADSYMTVYSLTGDQTYVERAVRLLARSGQFSLAKSLIEEHLGGNARHGSLPSGLLFRIYAGAGDLKETLRLLNSNPRLVEADGAARDFLDIVIRLPGGGPYSREIMRNIFLSLLVLGKHSQENRPWIIASIERLSDSGRHEAVKRVLLGIWKQDQALWAAARLFRHRAFSEVPGEGLKVFSEAKIRARRLDILRSDFMIRAGQEEQALKNIASLSACGGWIDEIRTLHLAEIYLHRKNYSKAMQYYEKLLSQYPDHLRAHAGRFRLYALRGQWVQANWEALGIFIIRGRLPELKEADRASGPGSVMNGIATGLPDPGEILSGSLCKDGGQACQLLLALSYEGHGNVQEAVSAWRAFLKRNPAYLPGYGRLVRLLRSFGDEDGARDLGKRACSLAGISAGDAAFSWPPEPPWVNGNPGFFWDSLKRQAMAVWQDIYCAH